MPSTIDFAALADPSVVFAPPPVSTLADDELLAEKVLLAEVRRRVDAVDALLAAELAHRSRPELGHDGLAQRNGARTPEKFIQTLTGVSARDARTQVRVGALVATLAEPEPRGPAEPWLGPVAEAVATGRLGLEAAEAIRMGVGRPTDDVPAEVLAAGVAELVAEAPAFTVEELATAARALRTRLDLARVADREAALRDRRSLALTRLPDGMTRLVALLDPENAAQVRAVVDAVTSPRLGGPRFVLEADQQAADDLVADARTTEQLALDAIVELLRLGSLADTATFIGARRPAAQLVVTLADLESGAGAAYFEGQSEAVSIATARRTVCESGVQPIAVGPAGNILELGREQRLYSRRQRIALAVRDGGCLWPSCDRPPSWCEAHHIDEWVRDHGKTDVDDGTSFQCDPWFGLGTGIAAAHRSTSERLSGARLSSCFRGRFGARKVRRTQMEDRQAHFEGTLLAHVAKLNAYTDLEDGQWTVKGFIDVHKNIYTISADTKIVSKILEIHIFPELLKFAEEAGYELVLADHQNYYPDISFVALDDPTVKFAVDLKTTYRLQDKPGYCNGFTLGSHGAYFIDRTGKKNIQFPYSEYTAHYCLGVIYDRALKTDLDETKIYDLADLETITSVISNLQFFLTEKWKIASDKSGSGNTANIGSINNVEEIVAGTGMFSRLGEAWFDDYWMNYGKISVRSPSGVTRKITDLESFLIYRGGDPSLIVYKHGSRKRAVNE